MMKAFAQLALLSALCLVGTAARTLTEQTVMPAGAQDGVRSMPPFTALDVGYSSCMPLSVLVVEGDGYGVSTTGQQAREQTPCGASAARNGPRGGMICVAFAALWAVLRRTRPR